MRAVAAPGRGNTHVFAGATENTSRDLTSSVPGHIDLSHGDARSTATRLEDSLLQRPERHVRRGGAALTGLQPMSLTIGQDASHQAVREWTVPFQINTHDAALCGTRQRRDRESIMVSDGEVEFVAQLRTFVDHEVRRPVGGVKNRDRRVRWSNSMTGPYSVTHNRLRSQPTGEPVTPAPLEFELSEDLQLARR